jgi:predicted amidohydrolase YtcJ
MKKINSIPLLNDYHTHTSFYMAMRKFINVRDIRDFDKAYEVISKLDDKINVVLGWSFGYKNREKIEKLGPTILCDGSLHLIIMNQKAKDSLKDHFPEIVSNIEDIEWLEHNIYSVLKFLPQIAPVNDNDVHEFFDYMLKENQIYSMEDLLLPNTDYIDMYERTGYDDRLKYWIDIKSYKTLPEKYKSKISGFKIFLDGAISPGTAAINGYCNTEFDGGMKLYTDEGLAADLKYAEAEGKSVAAHALGEIAIEQLVDIVEKENIKLPCLRIEHAQYISLDVAKRCKKLGITLSMQVCFSEESVLFKGKLTDECLLKNNPFRMLIDEAGYLPGEDLLFGSDGMPHGAKSALNNALFPPVENQKLTLDEFVKGYCLDTTEHGSINFEIEDNKVVNIVSCK